MLSFQDYVRLRYDADKNNETLYETVRQHDKDKVSYSEMYNILKGDREFLSDSIRNSAKRSETLFNISSDAIGYLMSLLVSNGLISKEQADETVKTILKMYSEDNKKKED